MAVWPGAAGLAALWALPRPAVEGVRWTRPEQWHVTLRFLGDADPEAVTGMLGARLGTVAAAAARMGPATAVLGRGGVLHVPVSGLDRLAESVIAATRDLGQPPREGPFRGHLTLARARTRGPALRRLAGEALTAAWRVDSVTLVSSVTGRGGSRYTVLEKFPLRHG